MSTATAPPVNHGPALDPEIFAGLMELVDEDDDGFVVELFGAYVSSHRECMDGMRRAHAAGDPDAMRRHAHTLKGASANVGASHLAALASHLQHLGESGQVDSADLWLDGIDAEFVRVVAEVGQRLPRFRA